MRAFTAVGLAAVLAVPAGASLAQQDRMAPGYQPGNPEAIIYRDRGYSGPAVNVTYPQPNMGLAWTVSSIRVKRGAWQLCERPNYGGRCTTYSQSYSNLGALRVQSLRPAYGPSPGPGPGPIPPIGGAPGPALRGMASEFFTQPSSRGQRIRSCRDNSGGANCARQTAEAFCRAQGYNHVGNVAQQTVGGTVYLADVLCRRSAG